MTRRFSVGRFSCGETTPCRSYNGERNLWQASSPQEYVLLLMASSLQIFHPDLSQEARSHHDLPILKVPPKVVDINGEKVQCIARILPFGRERRAGHDDHEM